MKALHYIQSDLYRYTGKTNILAGIKEYFSSSKFRWHVIFRLCQSLYVQKKGKILTKILWRIGSKKHFDISYKMQIGYGLYIGHNGPIVVSKSAVIGNNCNLSQGVTIGANDGLAAVVGDNVYFGPNVCVVENVHVGNNVTIGAGSVVTKDIPENATVAGNYARVLNYNEPARYINNMWK